MFAIIFLLLVNCLDIVLRELLSVDVDVMRRIEDVCVSAARSFNNFAVFVKNLGTDVHMRIPRSNGMSQVPESDWNN